jgi:hypothetical protein
MVVIVHRNIWGPQDNGTRTTLASRHEDAESHEIVKAFNMTDKRSCATYSIWHRTPENAYEDLQIRRSQNGIFAWGICAEKCQFEVCTQTPGPTQPLVGNEKKATCYMSR